MSQNIPESPQRLATAYAIAFPAALLAYEVFFYFSDVFALFGMVLVAGLGVLAPVVLLIDARKLRARAAVPLLGAVVATWAVWIFVPMKTIGLTTRFYVEQGSYDAAVRQVNAGFVPSCAAAKDCDFEEGPPARLAFSWGGILDNWVGVVYDPEDDVASHPERHKKIFGGDLVGCRAIKGHYYLCSFT